MVMLARRNRAGKRASREAVVENWDTCFDHGLSDKLSHTRRIRRGSGGFKGSSGRATEERLAVGVNAPPAVEVTMEVWVGKGVG